MKLYPLKFNQVYRSKVWGGRKIASLGHELPGDTSETIGESWEIADLDAADDDAMKSQEVRTTVANGSLAGKSLHDVIAQFGETLMGRLAPTPTGNFPLLVKYLDARENLSVQVHPSPQYAATHPEAHLKSEAWYIVDAEPGAVIYKGLQPGSTEASVRDAIERNDEQALCDLMIAMPVKAGDCHYLPSGTCHALGGGILVAEVQTPSDTTFRLYDWGRTDRTLHIEQALECTTFGPPDVAAFEKRSHVAGMFTTVSSLVKCEHFQIEKVRMRESFEQEIPYDQPAIWMILEGTGEIRREGIEPVTYQRGDTLLIPANMSDAKLVIKEDTVWLDVTFPKAMPTDVI